MYRTVLRWHLREQQRFYFINYNSVTLKIYIYLKAKALTQPMHHEVDNSFKMQE